ncbi:protein FAM83H [Esox lucius]|uniref:Scaffolding anchor of CK1 domain-containing protein n=1 Tax=Esox lucius TaxID=8010 RepID=A0A3P8X9N9_ESOLU|nr:protein FAM83H [Esox lucius]XP_010871608.5 protein FAM83H [Esox lucius]XP_019905670.3 protein FAM83H [Esox lucius]
MPNRSQSSDVGDNPLDPNYLPPHYREEYRIAIDALVENDREGYLEFLQKADVVDFLSEPEIEHIKSTIQTPNPAPTSAVPELLYHEANADGSSDTYWPLHSDTAAPGLDLGWPPQAHSFIGPTEVTTLVNPSEPEMPSIKEQARRLIKNAQHVIAVVMDMFTDVDLFADLLDAAARHVPVYILLDEQNACYFVSMVHKCNVNLDLIHMMRVRTVAGVTYFCRTGKSFKGQVKDRFLLADCRAVLSGNYSFMWSYEKLHRCIAHLFLGELVASFDEEFRILFAQSQPLTVDHALVPVSSDNSYYSKQFGLKRTQSLLNPRGFQRNTPELQAFPLGGGDLERTAFRRDDLFRHNMEPGGGLTFGKFATSQQFRMQQSFLEQGRSMVSRQMEISAIDYKRHSYAEGTQESYSSSRQYMKHRVMNNLEETEQQYRREQVSHLYQGGEVPGLMPGLGSGMGGSGSGHGHYDRLRNRLALDQYSDSGYPHEEPPGSEGYSRDYLSSGDLKPHLGQPPAGDRYGGGVGQKRPSVGQSYACQPSPTHPHPPEKHLFAAPAESGQDKDPNLRSWRINSFLSTCEDPGEEGLSQPMGPDAFEEQESEGKPYAAEGPAPRYGVKEPPNVPSKPRVDIRPPRYGKPFIPERTDSRTAEWERDKLREAGVDVEVPPSREAPGEVGLSKNESFRTRINPMLQRSSRLRSSLIFSSSKTESHLGSLGMKVADEEEEDSNLIRTTSIVQQILEKRRSMTREPFEWRKKAEEAEMEKKGKEEKMAQLKEEAKPMDDTLNVTPASRQVPKHTLAEVESQKNDAASTNPTQPQPINMNDPASRLKYFKELAAKRNASKEAVMKEPPQKKPDHSEPPSSVTTPTSSTSTTPVPSVCVTAPEPAPKQLEIPATPEPTRKLSLSSIMKTFEPSSTAAQRKDSSSESSKKEKEASKTLKPALSPKIIKRELLKPFKSSNPRRVSYDEDMLTTDATDAEKSKLKKSRSLSTSGMLQAEVKDGLHKNLGSNTSLNSLAGEGKVDAKPMDFIKKQTQRLKGFLGTKDKKSSGSATTASSSDDKGMSTVPESSEEPGTVGKPLSSPTADTKTIEYTPPAANHKAASKTTSPSRYHSSGGSILFSSNLRDDTKVILEQISANSQKNRLERGGGEEVKVEKGVDVEGEEGGLQRGSSIRNSRFQRPPVNPQERESLLKRMESMRKEKKVYSRFEMGNNLG